MCNDYRLEINVAAIAADFSELKIKIFYPEGAPNLQPRADIRITDSAPIIRSKARGTAELVQRRWSWPGPTGKPVYNMRAEGREFTKRPVPDRRRRLLRVHDSDDLAKKRKDKWLFTKKGELLFRIVGIWSAHPKLGEAFTMLTLPPGPAVATYHDRQVAVMERRDWGDWLDPTVSAKSILHPLPAGSLCTSAKFVLA